jgi:phospholipid/cholesterol/gamma-HCH transport system substrate-binding protein
MKAFTKEARIGLTVVVAFALLIYGLNFLKGINLFQKSNLYYIAFHNISGLAESNPVYANGYRIGIVRSIDYDYKKPGNVYVGIEIDENMRISEGSYAELESQMLGGVTMNIILAPSPKTLSPGDTITGGPKVGALDMAGQMVPQIQSVIPKLDSILMNINKLLMNPALNQTLCNTAQITENLKTTTATINKLLEGNVNSIAQNLEPTTKNLQDLTEKLNGIDYLTTMNNVNQTLVGVQQTTKSLNDAISSTVSKLNQPNSSLGLLLNDRGLYDNLNRNLVSSDSLLNDIRLHPKRYVHFSVFGSKTK